VGAAVAAGTLALAGCGGGERQDADEPAGTFAVDIVRAQFPARQHLAQQSAFVITVRNRGREAIPNLAVTVRGFATRDRQPDLSDPTRPLWIVDRAPAAGVTAYDDTWTAGRVEPGRAATLRWHVTPVVAGTHRVTYAVAAGLNGRARAQLADGRRPQGAITVRVDEEPATARVDPATGRVLRSGDR
jgi:hypothetical protein